MKISKKLKISTLALLISLGGTLTLFSTFGQKQNVSPLATTSFVSEADTTPPAAEALKATQVSEKMEALVEWNHNEYSELDHYKLTWNRKDKAADSFSQTGNEVISKGKTKTNIVLSLGKNYDLTLEGFTFEEEKTLFTLETDISMGGGTLVAPSNVVARQLNTNNFRIEFDYPSIMSKEFNSTVAWNTKPKTKETNLTLFNNNVDLPLPSPLSVTKTIMSNNMLHLTYDVIEEFDVLKEYKFNAKFTGPVYKTDHTIEESATVETTNWKSLEKNSPPSATPTELVAEQIAGTTSMKVTWSHPNPDSVYDYKLNWKSNDETKSGEKVIRRDENGVLATEHIITGLILGKTYDLEITSSSNQNTTRSTVLTTEKISIKDEVNISILDKTDTNVKFKYTSISEKQDQTICVLKDGKLQKALAPTQNREIEVENLTENTKYTISVNSIEKEVTTLKTKPTTVETIDKIEDTIKTKSTKDSIVLTWDYTQTGVSYTAEYIVGGKGTLTPITPTISDDKTTVTLSIDNLIRGVNYEVEITSSINIAGKPIKKTTTIGFILGNTDSKMSTTSIVLIVIVSIIAVASAITILYIFILKK